MSGHSKWNNIKNKKGAADAKRSKIFTQLSKQIRIAVKDGKSGDSKFNPSLRLALEKARAHNMPKDKIQKAIDRGLGKSTSGVAIQEILYEGFGPGGVAIIVQALTDNPHRTSSEMKYIFSRAGGALSGPGSAMFMFHKQQTADGESYVPAMPMTVENDTMEAIEELIETFLENEDVEDVFCSVELPSSAL